MHECTRPASKVCVSSVSQTERTCQPLVLNHLHKIVIRGFGTNGAGVSQKPQTQCPLLKNDGRPSSLTFRTFPNCEAAIAAAVRLPSVTSSGATTTRPCRRIVER